MLHGIHNLGAMRYVLGEVSAVRAVEHHASLTATLIGCELHGTLGVVRAAKDA